jgi:hypothetical protein
VRPSRNAESSATVRCADVTNRATSIKVRVADIAASADTVARSKSGNSVVVWM